MTACPYCFAELNAELAFRCVGRCSQREDPVASACRNGRSVMSTPVFISTDTAAPDAELGAAACPDCGVPTSLQACPQCHENLPEGWRGQRTLTVAVTGARGAGKSVYIAVLIAMLNRYANKRNVAIDPMGVTDDLYRYTYYDKVFSNKSMSGTQPGFNDVMMWRVAAPGQQPFYLIVRDVAGEDIERLTSEKDPSFGFIGAADLVIFLFDPMALEKVQAKLDGVISAVDMSRLGDKPQEALPKVLNQSRSKHTNLALVISKFDALHTIGHRVGGHDPLAKAMANPAAHYNWDRTWQRASVEPATARHDLEQDLAFLDAELRSLLPTLSDDSITARADQMVQEDCLREVRHFAISSVGDSARHAEKLTLRGISPFRVLDPVLWAMSSKGYTF